MGSGKTVLATGAFDLLHLGHLRFLEESRKRGGPKSRLVVVIARDRTVERRKGRRPIIPEEQRRLMVQALKPVSKAILGREEVDFLGIIELVKPDIVSVGHDQNDIKTAVKRIIQEEKLPIRVVQIRHYGPTNLNSSTSLKMRVIKTHRS